MTITVTDLEAGPYVATGATQTVPFSFMSLSDAEVSVIVVTDDLGESPLAAEMFAVQRNRELDGSPAEGGSVTLSPGAILTGSTFYLRANPSDEQDQRWSDTGSRLRNLNDALDRGVLRDLALSKRLDRAILGMGASFDLASAIGARLVGYSASGAGAVPRTMLEKERERGVSVRDFGAVGDGVHDDLAAFNAAVASGARRIYIPSVAASYRLSDTWNVTRSVEIVGDGCVPYVGAIVANQPVTRGPGSWIKCDHAGEGIKFYGVAGQELSGGKVIGIGTIRNQPAPGVGWTPANNGFDLVFLSGDWWFDDIMLWNPTCGVLHDYAGQGRLEGGRIHMAPYQVGFQIDRCFDIFRVRDIHMWPFSGIHTSQNAYRYANLVGMRFKDVDHTMIGNYFSIGTKNAIELLAGADGGAPLHIQFDKVQADLFGNIALYVDGAATGASFEIGTFYGQGAVAGDGNASGALGGIVINADLSEGKVGLFQINRVGQQAAIINGAGSKLSLGQPTVNEWNLSNVSATAFAVPNASSSIHLIGKGRYQIGIHGGAAVDVTGRISSQEWSDDTPVPSATTGLITSASGDNQWNRLGDVVSINVKLTITNNGTGSGAITTSVPVPARSGRTFTVSGQDANGAMISGRISGSTMTIRNATGGYPAVSGSVLSLTGFYEANPL